MKCEDCVYAEIADWEQDKKTGKATPVYWCEKTKKTCENVCDKFDNGELKGENNNG